MINENGYFNITPKLTDYDRYYLHNFHATPHLKRKVDKLNQYYEGRNGYNGEYGTDGEFFIKHVTDDKGKIITSNHTYNLKELNTIIDFKNQPRTQPSMDCPWKPNSDGTKLMTSGGVEHYQHDYGWIKWLINNIFDGKYTLNGEYSSKKGYDEKIITLRDNKVGIRVKKGKANKPASISLDTGRLIINNKPKKKKEDHEIVTDIINKTKNGNLIWENSHIKSYGEKYLTSIDFGSGVKILLSLFIKEFNSKNNYINIHIKKGEELFFYKSISNYFIRDLVKLVDK